MKILPWLRASVVLFLLGVAAAQKNAELEVPVENEPHHHLVFENEYVRVFKVEVAPHEATLVHRHKRDYVVVTIGDAEVTNAVVGKEPKKWSFKDGDVTFLEASGEKSFAHKAVNESDKSFVNYTIEIKVGTGQSQATLEKCEGSKFCGKLEDCTSLGCSRLIAKGERFSCDTFSPGRLGSRVVLEDKPYLVVRLRYEVPKDEQYSFKWLKSGKDQAVAGASLTCEFGAQKTQLN